MLVDDEAQPDGAHQNSAEQVAQNQGLLDQVHEVCQAAGGQGAVDDVPHHHLPKLMGAGGEGRGREPR